MAASCWSVTAKEGKSPSQRSCRPCGLYWMQSLATGGPDTQGDPGHKRQVKAWFQPQTTASLVCVDHQHPVCSSSLYPGSLKLTSNTNTVPVLLYYFLIFLYLAWKMSNRAMFLESTHNIHICVCLVTFPILG